MLAICERAHADLIQGRADVFLFGDTRTEGALIPPKFWWAEGHEALVQDWSLGDFSTVIDRRIETKAFGVKFDFEGLKKLLPVEKAGVILRELSVSGNPDWMPAASARRFMYERVGLNPAAAGEGLVDQCKLAFVPGRAQLMQAAGSQPGPWTSEEREWDIPTWFWQNFTMASASAQDWARGIFSGKGKTPAGTRYITLTGVYFGKAAVESLAGQAAGAEPDVPQSKGGRPRKEWWDDLWCAVWGRIVHGELTPKTQADVERAMLDWVSERGETVAESTIRPMARKLFAEWDREGKN